MTRLCGRTVSYAFVASLAFASAAKADLMTTWDFSGTVNSVAPITTAHVTGSFTLDQSTSTVSAFDFTFGNGSLIAPSATPNENFRSSVITSIAGETELLFSNFNAPNRDSLTLFFDTPILSFNGADFLTTSSTPAADSRINCIDSATFGCGSVGASGDFVSGSAMAVPEPASLSLLGSSLIVVGVLRWRKRKEN